MMFGLGFAAGVVACVVLEFVFCLGAYANESNEK
jgi:hypothetical protein